MGSGREKPTSRRPSRPGAKTTRSAEPPPAPSPEAAPEPVAGEQDEARPPQSDFPIVGVGASAGGLEAFRQLLGALPTTPAWPSCSCSTWTPPRKHPGRAAGQGKPHAGLRGQGGHGGRAQPRLRHPRAATTSPSRADVLKLVPARSPRRGRHLPIDSFLRTLAEARGSKAIGVVLSGTGSDGTLGAEGDQGGRRHHLRPGPGLGRLRRHAAQRHRLGVRGLRPAARSASRRSSPASAAIPT